MPKTFGELGLRPREWDVIKACLHARDVTPTGYYICSPGQIAAGKRLIERGFVTDVTKDAGLRATWPGWLVVMIGQANIEAMDKA